jgi:DNA processing protein
MEKPPIKNLPDFFCFCILNFMDDERIYANALNQSLQIGPVSLRKIKEYFGSFKTGWDAPFNELKETIGIKKLEEFRNKVNPEKQFEQLEKEGVGVLLAKELPKCLTEIDTPPEILYLKGVLPKEKIQLAVVGPRKFSSYGKDVCQKLVRELSEYDAVIISGLAIGIDSIAHKTALESGLKTIAVLGSGLNESVLYPQINIKLAREIIEKGGCLISEYPLLMKAAQFTFPQRNRIIAGLAAGTLVIEAAQRSGALITAFMALEYNRDVFAVPGDIFSLNSKGTNTLLKMGAWPVTEVNDILRGLGIEPAKTCPEIKLTPEEQRIISFLIEPLERDELVRKSKLRPSELNYLLSKMEITGIIKETRGKIYKT